MLDQESITQQLALLAAHRRTLAHLLKQAAQYGGEVFAPPQTANGIAEARVEIRRIKATLRKNGVRIENEPNDKTPQRRKPAQAQQTGDVIRGDKVGGDKVAGDKRNVDTSGGDYAEGNIDKRQGEVFVENSTIYGNVIGKQSIHLPSSSSALHQLRAPVSDFVGRKREIKTLVQALSKAATSGTAVSISSVRGMGGIGKTELAHVVAHRLKHIFPDAQLLVELRGASSPLTPEQALQTVIHSFEWERKLPDNLSQLRGIYCSVLTYKRVLILADDAEGVKQVRPLLPPPGCALLVTSRKRFGLPGMVAIDLEVLAQKDGEELLLSICARIGEHASELAKLCGYLPLALRVSATLLEANSSREVELYLKQLRVARLKHLSDPDNPDDPQASVDASLALSYRALDKDVQSALCQMSVFPANFDKKAATAVVIVKGDVFKILDELERRGLLEWDESTERYNLHDLVREFAVTRLKDADAVRLRHAQYYATFGKWAGSKMKDALRLIFTIARERVHINTAWAWAYGKFGHLPIDEILYDCALAVVFARELVYGLQRENIRYLESALAAANKWGNPEAQMIVLIRLGTTYASLDDINQAIEHHYQALYIARDLGDRRSERGILNSIGIACAKSGHIQLAVAFLNQCLAITLEVDDLPGASAASWNLGLALAFQGNLALAVELMQFCVDYEREIRHSDAEKHAARVDELRQRLAASQDAPPPDAPDEG